MTMEEIKKEIECRMAALWDSLPETEEVKDGVTALKEAYVLGEYMALKDLHKYIKEMLDYGEKRKD